MTYAELESTFDNRNFDSLYDIERALIDGGVTIVAMDDDSHRDERETLLILHFGERDIPGDDVMIAFRCDGGKFHTRTIIYSD